jgi:hypothetical protein
MRSQAIVEEREYVPKVCGPNARNEKTTATQEADPKKSELIESYRAFGLSPREAAMAADIENAVFCARRSQ